MRALVVGGTGPTGPHIAGGLQERGYEVTILHRGSHELPELDGMEHIHADPHFRDALDEALGARRFDLTVATYGRLRHVADAVAGRTETFLAVSGLPIYPGYHQPDEVWPPGMAVLAAETAADGSRPPRVGESGVVERMTDQFDYAEEDRVVSAYREVTGPLLASQGPTEVAAHPYPHPKQAGALDHRQR